MIAVSDLRIGNWVHDGERTKFPMYVQTIGDDYVYLNFEGNEGDVFESTPDELHGIPLTENILLKMGFSCFDRDIWSREEGCYHIGYTTTSGFMTIERYENHRCVSRCSCLNVRYVHEVQNLCYCIAREELRIAL